MHNLFPAIGEVNGDRANFRFSDWNGKPNQYGKCQMLVDGIAGCSRPGAGAWPDRPCLFYHGEQYGLRLAQQRKLFEAWDRPLSGGSLGVRAQPPHRQTAGQYQPPSLKSGANSPIYGHKGFNIPSLERNRIEPCASHVSMNRPPAGRPDPGPVGRRVPTTSAGAAHAAGPAARAVQRRRPPVSRHHHECGQKSVEVRIDRCDTSRWNRPAIHLGQVISRGDKMDFTIQKSVELGVTLHHPALLRALRRQAAGGSVGEEARAVAEGGDQRLRAVRPQYRARGAHAHGAGRLARGRNERAQAQPAPAGPYSINTLPVPEHGVRLLIGPEGLVQRRDRPYRAGRLQRRCCWGPRCAPRPPP